MTALDVERLMQDPAIIRSRAKIEATIQGAKIFEVMKNEAEDLGRMLAKVVITITQRAGEEGHLFGSVTAKDIADGLERQNYTIDRRKIQLEDPIKNVGEYKVPVRLHRDVTAEITVNVAAE